MESSFSRSARARLAFALAIVLGTYLGASTRSVDAESSVVETGAVVGSEAPYDSVGMSQLGRAIEASLSPLFPDAFGGLSIDETAGELVVQVVPTDEVGDLMQKVNDIASRYDDISYRFENVRVSQSLLREAVARFTEDKSWAGTDALRYSLGTDERLGQQVVELLVDDLQVGNRLLDKLRSLAPGLPIRLHVSALPRPDAHSAISRYADTSPYYAGIPLWRGAVSDHSVGSAYCTSGFRMDRGGNQYFSSAMHCGPVGQQYTSTQYPSASIAKVSETWIQDDTALVARWNNGFYSPNVWFGGPNTRYHNPITGKFSAILPGQVIWSSGANGGNVAIDVMGIANCRVNGRDTTFVYGRTNFGYPNSGAYTRPGDSGGPVLKHNSGTSNPDDVAALGIHNCGNGVDRSWDREIAYLESDSGARVVMQ